MLVFSDFAIYSLGILGQVLNFCPCFLIREMGIGWYLLHNGVVRNKQDNS